MAFRISGALQNSRLLGSHSKLLVPLDNSRQICCTVRCHRTWRASEAYTTGCPRARGVEGPLYWVPCSVEGLGAYTIRVFSVAYTIRCPRELLVPLGMKGSWGLHCQVRRRVKELTPLDVPRHEGLRSLYHH